MIKIGLLGLGTVGGGVVNLLAKNASVIRERTGEDIEITLVALKDIKKQRICSTDHITLTKDVFKVVNNNDIDIVLELIGGSTVAKSLVEMAIKNGKHVITANKALIASYGNELLLLAKKHNVVLLFEASVAGGIPILKVIKQGLSANNINMIAGIINGTSNFILTKLTKEGGDFKNVLKKAQQLGYAEADPTFDINGTDAAHKIAILSALAFNTSIAFDKVIIDGISNINIQDIKFADKLGYSIKHLGITKKDKSNIQMRVHPTLIPKDNLLADIAGVMNAVLVNADPVGNTIYYGNGAGSDATASAVIADLIDIILDNYISNTIKNNDTVNYLLRDDIISAYYVCLLVNDKAGVLADISKIFASNKINIESVIQNTDYNSASIAIITEKVACKNIQVAISEINKCDFVLQKAKILFVEDFNFIK